jgi:hypothetical protein
LGLVGWLSRASEDRSHGIEDVLILFLWELDVTINLAAPEALVGVCFLASQADDESSFASKACQ